MAKKPKQKMMISERAKQFMPFAALKGLPEALAEKEHITAQKPELSEDRAEELNQILQQIQCGDMLTVIYFRKNEYLKITGKLARLDSNSRVLQIVQTKIPFDDILDINASM
ncbi:MAG: YolD-like family protein [Clostridiaceae bacterium]|nr:YolD-like family protein [Clostridiaceae bacterium]